MARPKLESLIRIADSMAVGTITTGGSPYNVTMSAADFTLTAGISSSKSFLTYFKERVEAAVGSGTCTMTLDDTSDTATGKVTFAFSANFTFAWTSTTIRDLLGFTGDLSTAATASFQGSKQSTHVWLPDVGRTNPEGPEGGGGSIEHDATLGVATSGALTSLGYSYRRLAVFEFVMVGAPKTWSVSESTPNESFETFFLSGGLVYGKPFRYFPDRSDDASSTLWIREPGLWAPTAMVAGWTGSKSRWGFGFRARKYTP